MTTLDLCQELLQAGGLCLPARVQGPLALVGELPQHLLSVPLHMGRPRAELSHIGVQGTFLQRSAPVLGRKGGIDLAPVHHGLLFQDYEARLGQAPAQLGHGAHGLEHQVLG